MVPECFDRYEFVYNVSAWCAHAGHMPLQALMNSESVKPHLAHFYLLGVRHGQLSAGIPF